MLLHSSVARHPVEDFEILTICLHSFSCALLVSCQHATKHDKVRASTKGLRYVARAGAASVRDDSATKAVGCICALQDCGQLRVANSCLLPSCANAARPNANLDDIRTAKDELFCHFLGDDVAGYYGVPWELCSHVANAPHKSLRV